MDVHFDHWFTEQSLYDEGLIGDEHLAAMEDTQPARAA